MPIRAVKLNTPPVLSLPIGPSILNPSAIWSPESVSEAFVECNQRWASNSNNDWAMVVFSEYLENMDISMIWLQCFMDSIIRMRTCMDNACLSCTRYFTRDLWDWARVIIMAENEQELELSSRRRVTVKCETPKKKKKKIYGYIFARHKTYRCTNV